MSTDPVHIGTGGFRLGRVDNSIVREPGTRLPKIPGTSLSGAIRSYAAARNGHRECAGQQKQSHQEEGYPLAKCPVCYTFGVANDTGGGYSGMVSIGDARLLLFPIYSMQGPVWVTSPRTLQDAGFTTPDTLPKDAQALFSGGIKGNALNLGWLMVSKQGELPALGLSEKIEKGVCQRIVLISEKLFSQVVNSNLEVRTSVSINPETGAAEEKALFTYEAIPRAAFFWMDVIEDNFRDKFPKGNESGWKTPLDVVEAGMEWMEHLGVGGMGTRGFGRIRKVAQWEV